MNDGSGVTLHKFLKTEIGLKKWLACLNSDKLKGLSVKELQNKYVCQKHFEKKFYTSSHLSTSSYPTLFNQEEMGTGIPALAFEESDFNMPTTSTKPDTLNSEHQFIHAQSRNPCRTHTKPKRNFYADNLKAESNTQYKKILKEYQKAEKQLTYANRVKRALKF